MISGLMHELTRIEPATIEDLPLLAELLMELFSQERDFRPDYNNQMRGLPLILENPSRARFLYFAGRFNYLPKFPQPENGQRTFEIRSQLRAAKRFFAHHAPDRPDERGIADLFRETRFLPV